MQENNQLSEITSMIVDFSSDVVVTDEIIAARRMRILQLEEAMNSHDESFGMVEFNEGKITRHFGTGVYGRELFIPKDNVLVSKIHKNKTLNIIAKGKISVIDPETGYKTFTAPHVFVSSPMTKRVVIAHEDTLWITAHENADNSEDLVEVENKTIAESFVAKIESKKE